MLNITAFCCHNALYGGADVRTIKKADVANVHKVELPCSSRLEPIHILKAFENGADGVVVVACPITECKLIEGSKRVGKRVNHAKRLLAEAGMSPERIVLVRPEIPAADAFAGIVAAAVVEIEKLG